MNKIKSEDEVIVIAGKDKGKRGKVLSVKPGENVIVEGVNLVTKYIPKSQPHYIYNCLGTFHTFH